MRIANRIKSEFLFTLLHNNRSVLSEMTPNRQINNSPLTGERGNLSLLGPKPREDGKTPHTGVLIKLPWLKRERHAWRM